jgi:hypothetical protein
MRAASMWQIIYRELNLAIHRFSISQFIYDRLTLAIHILRWRR